MNPLDLSSLDREGAIERLGEAVALCLGASGAIVLVKRSDDRVTLLGPGLLSHVEPEEMAAALLAAGWGEDETCNFLSSLVNKGARAPG